MKQILVLGEVLLRLTPPGNLKIGQNNSFNMCFGGAEANVAVGLANLGIGTRIITALPNNELGDYAKSFLRSYGVDCNYIVTKGERVGLYYYEEGCSARKAKVVYDRKYSSINELRYDDIDIDCALENIELLHVSGITFALSDDVREVAMKIIDKAKEKGIKISVDLNYRAKLFKSYYEFVSIMKPVVKDSYICFGWLNKDTENFKVLDASEDEISDEVFIEKFRYMKEDLNVRYVATTLRTGSPFNYHTLSGILFDGNKIYRSSKYEFNMISRIGGGDAFASGIIKKLVCDSISDNEAVIEFGTATAVLKQTQIGDVSISTESDVIELIENKNLGSVNR